MTNIAQVAVGVINLIEDGRFIYSIAANAMDSVESQNSELSGADKKASVPALPIKDCLSPHLNKF